MEELVPLAAIVCLFVILPGMIMHYTTKSRSQRGLSSEDERMLEDLWRSAKVIETRIEALEEIVAGEFSELEAPATEKGQNHEL